MDGVQFVAPSGGLGGVRRSERIVDLGPADVPAMLALTDLTRPGPFGPRTVEMGSFVGVREDGRLVAMAGERLAPPDWVEISAVCTAPEARGRGLARHLVRELTARIDARGERAFLHVGADNPTALALYADLGFRRRRDVTFRGFRVPPRR